MKFINVEAGISNKRGGWTWYDLTVKIVKSIANCRLKCTRTYIFQMFAKQMNKGRYISRYILKTVDGGNINDI